MLWIEVAAAPVGLADYTEFTLFWIMILFRPHASYGPGNSLRACFRQAPLQRFGDPLDIHQRHVPSPTFNSGLVGPMQPAPLRSLLLRDSLFLGHSFGNSARGGVFGYHHVR